jgi:hypothetical protein
MPLGSLAVTTVPLAEADRVPTSAAFVGPSRSMAFDAALLAVG